LKRAVARAKEDWSSLFPATDASVAYERRVAAEHVSNLLRKMDSIKVVHHKFITFLLLFTFYLFISILNNHHHADIDWQCRAARYHQNGAHWCLPFPLLFVIESY